MVTVQRIGLGPYQMFDSLLLVSLKMVLIRNLEMTMITGISNHIINFVKITSDREKKAYITFNSVNSEDVSNFHEGWRSVQWRNQYKFR